MDRETAFQFSLSRPVRVVNMNEPSVSNWRAIRTLEHSHPGGPRRLANTFARESGASPKNAVAPAIFDNRVLRKTSAR